MMRIYQESKKSLFLCSIINTNHFLGVFAKLQMLILYILVFFFPLKLKSLIRLDEHLINSFFFYNGVGGLYFSLILILAQTIFVPFNLCFP